SWPSTSPRSGRTATRISGRTTTARSRRPRAGTKVDRPGPIRPASEIVSRPMVHALLVLAAEEAEPSRVGWDVCGGGLAGWAVVLGVLGLRSPEFPGGLRGERIVITISVVLVAAAMTSAVVTS